MATLWKYFKEFVFFIVGTICLGIVMCLTQEIGAGMFELMGFTFTSVANIMVYFFSIGMITLLFFLSFIGILFLMIAAVTTYMKTKPKSNDGKKE